MKLKAMIAALLVSGVVSANSLDRSGTMYAPFIEWHLVNPSYSENPFDLIATAWFTHTKTGETHATEMFFAGNDTWSFRFTGTRVGTWTFKTSSDDADLNGHSGTVTIASNANLKIRGFLRARNNRFAIQTGDNATLSAYRFNVYMNQVNFPPYLGDMRSADEVDAYFTDAQKHGFEVIFIAVCNSWFEHGTKAHTEHKRTDPDPKSFALLENIITRIHAKGGRVHLWAWGDESRKWTPIGVGGINGVPDLRLQRYLAACLGPLPGWTMGYGFDLHEWTKPAQLDAWAQSIHTHSGWRHLLCARGENGPNLDINAYDGFGRSGVELVTSSGGPHNYAEIVSHLDSDTARPHLYEERHSYKRARFNLDMDGTRRLLWWQTLAGGMGGFYGFYPSSSSAHAGYPYPHPEQLRCVSEFWRGRFRLDMLRANELSANSDTYVLKGANDYLVLYRENAASINIDLSGLHGSAAAVAVDTKKAYAEIDLKTLPAKRQAIALPYISDWAIAIGKF
jgi:hypothetical protein